MTRTHLTRRAARLVFVLLWSLSALATTHSALRADDEEADYEIHEMSLWGLDPTLEQANHLQHYPSAMPGVVETDRSRTGQPGRLSPFSLLTFHGQAVSDLELDLRVQNGRFLGHWLAAQSKSGRLRWIELVTTAEPLDTAKEANVDAKHWFNQARQLDGLHVSHTSRSERFLTYDCELKYAAAVKLAGGSDVYQVTNLTTVPLADIYVVVPDGDKRRIGHLATMPAGKPQPPAPPQAQPQPPTGQPAAVPGLPPGTVPVPAAPAAPAPAAAAPAAPAKVPEAKPADEKKEEIKKADDADEKDAPADDTAKIEERKSDGKPAAGDPDAKPDDKPDVKPAEAKSEAKPTPFLVDNFAEAKPSVWKTGAGQWEYADGRLLQKQTGNVLSKMQTLADLPRDFKAALRLKITGGATKNVGLAFDDADKADYERLYLSAHGMGVAIEHQRDGKQSADSKQMPVNLNQEYLLEIEVRDRAVNVSVDGQPMLAFRLPFERRTGKLALWTFDATAEFISLEVTSLMPPPAPTPPPAPEEPGIDVVMSPPMADDSAELAEIKESFAEGLRKSGLTAKEVELFMTLAARSIFGANEMVIVYRLPAAVIEERLPLVSYPAPRKTVRVALMVVRNIDPRIKDEVQRLVAELGADDYTQREKAEKRLAELGRLAVPVLKTVLNSADPEVAYRAERILLSQNEKIDGT